MNDFAQTTLAKSDQINNADLIGNDITITITKVHVDLKSDQPVSISFEGSDKVYRPCKGMRRVIQDLWKNDPALYIGRSLTLYRDPDVRFGADTTGGTRIRAASHIDGVKKVTVPVSRGKVKTYAIEPLKDAPKRAQRQAEPEAPPAMSEAEAIAAINATTTLAELQTAFTDLFRNHRATADLPSVKQAKDDRKAALTPPADDGDEIPL